MLKFDFVITWPVLCGIVLALALGCVALFLRERRRRARARLDEFD